MSGSVDNTISAASDASVEAAIAYAKKYLEDTLSFFGLNTEVEGSSDEEVIQLSVPSTSFNGFLIGQHGETMRALQYLVSMALKNQNYEHNRVNVDVADYKKQRAERLREKAEVWMQQVTDTGEELALEPMNAADRRIVHQLAVERGLQSESAGEYRERHIVLKPAATN